MPSFEVFCAEEALRQRREGVDVPTVTKPYAYTQWCREAQRRWRSRQGEDDRILFAEEIKGDAETIVATVVERASSGKCRPFPLTLNVDGELQVVLSSLELMLRFFFLNSQETALLTAIRGLRRQAADLRSKGVLGCARGKYPEVYVLYEFFSLRRLLLNWEKLGVQNQKAAVETALLLAGFVRSPAYTALETQLKVAKEESYSIAPNVTNILTCLEQACLDTPYAFPSVCCDVIAAVYPDYTGPLGRLVPELLPTDNKMDGNDINRSHEGPFRPVTEVSFHEAKQRRLEHQTPPHTVTLPQHNSAAVRKDYEVCFSRYHEKYSTPQKHASKECRFCVVCHMMEMLFNGDTRKCCWGHGPTERKIAFHLKRHPGVYDLALQRLALLRQGSALAPCDIPFDR